MKTLLKKAIELAKAGYWDAAIDLLEQALIITNKARLKKVKNKL